LIDAARRPTNDIESLSRLMDACFEVPGLGWRFGLNTIVDLVPGMGDAATSLVAFSIVVSAVRRGIPRPTLVRMALNVAIYAVIGIVPFLGDLADTWFKPNMRNMALLRRSLDAPADADRADRFFVIAVLGGLALLLVGSLAFTVWLLSRIF
jgi:hypothetical protein